MNTTTKGFTVVIGIIMSVAMVGSLIIPLLSRQATQVDAPQPTAIPEPTFPPPPDEIGRAHV